MSLSSRITARLAITTLIAAAIGYGWLYLKQIRVESYLRERALVRQAEEISNYLSATADGSVMSAAIESICPGYSFSNSASAAWRLAAWRAVIITDAPSPASAEAMAPKLIRKARY